MSEKQGSLTLKEYLHQYLVAKSPKTSINDCMKSRLIEGDCEKLFHKKLTSIKKLIKNLVKDSLAQGAIEKELEELKIIFKESRGSLGFASKDFNETTDLSKNSRKAFKKKDISIPAIPILDNSLDDLRITNSRVSEEKKQTDSKIILPKKNTPYIKGLKQQNYLLDENQNIPETPNFQTDSRVYKANSKQYKTQVTPSFPNTTKSRNSEINFFVQGCLPPALDKKMSLLDSIRNTKKNQTIQYITNEKRNQSNI